MLQTLLTVCYMAMMVAIGLSAAQSSPSTCVLGYEPDTAFPNCTLRRTELFNYTFSIVTGVPYNSAFDYSKLCISDVAWSTMYAVMSSHPYYIDFLGYMLQCFNTWQPVVCWNFAVSFRCGCWDNCDALNRTQTFIQAYAAL